MFTPKTDPFRPESTPFTSENPFASAPTSPFGGAASPFTAAPNPFAPKAPEAARPEPVPAGPVSRDAVEVRVFWGEELLQVIELSPPRALHVGDAAVGPLAPEVTIPGVEGSFAIVTVDGGQVQVHAPPGARLAERPRGAARAAAVPVVAGITTLEDGIADVTVGALTLSVRHGGREARCPRALSGDRDARPLAYFGLTATFTAAFAGALAMYAPPLGLADDEGIDRDRMYLLSQYLDAAAERERLRQDEPAQDPGEAALNAPLEPAAGESGAMGRPEVHSEPRRASGVGQGEPRAATTRAEQIAEAATFGLAGMLASGIAGATPAPWDDNGAGNVAAAGGLFGLDIGDGPGMGGLGLLGPGEGGGGHSNQIGLASIGTCQGAACTAGMGWGVGSSRPGGNHKPKPPSIRTATTEVLGGSLPAEVIQRVVRQSFGRFRACYEDGLRSNPNLEGRVTARFVIGRDGAVSAVQKGGSDLPDERVVSCVLRAYGSLSFPSPKDGIVRVSYPLMFTPGS